MTNTKKVLIVTYYWPPAGGPGVQRWLKFVKYLPKFGVEPIVFVPENPSYPIIDESLVNDVPENLKVIKHPIREVYKLASLISKNKSNIISKGIIPKSSRQNSLEKLLIYVRGNYFIPDARKFWVKPSVEYLKEYLPKNGIETIITTGPPHSIHLIGLQLKERLKIKWIADFRDPWTTIGYHKKLRLNVNSQNKHKQLELNVLNIADQIIVTSSNTKAEFVQKTPKPIEIITNGYDKTDTKKSLKDEKFSLAHIGSLLSDRNPRVLWKVLSELVEERKDFRNKFRLKLIGTVSEDVMQDLETYNLTGHLDYFGYVEHDIALMHQSSSQLLLLIEIDTEETKAIIPGKIFEYLNSGTPIVALGPEGSDIQRLINDTESGSYFDYNSEIKLKNQILRFFEEYKLGSLESKTKNTEMFSRENLTKQLAQLI